MKKKQIMMVVIWDLSVAFNMVDHDILLSILNKQLAYVERHLSGSTATYNQDSSE